MSLKVLEEENMEIISTILGCEMLASVKYAQYLLEGHSQKRYFGQKLLDRQEVQFSLVDSGT